MTPRLPRPLLFSPSSLLCLLLLFVACESEKETDIPFTDADGNMITLNTRSKKALSGSLNFTQSGEYMYSLSEQCEPRENISLEIEYALNGEGERGETAALRAGDGTAWLLPLSLSFLRPEPLPPVIRYRVPVKRTYIQNISIKTEGVKNSALVLRVKALRIVPRTYGFSEYADGIELSPFIKKEAAYIVSVPEEHRHAGRVQLVAGGLSAGARVVCGARAFEYLSPDTSAVLSRLTFPAAAIGANPYPVEFAGKAERLLIASASVPPFPTGPRAADPYFTLGFPHISWRDERYEVFRWESFPSILIIDTLNYDIQNRMLKRLAFFSEKKGFRGRLLSDAEMAGLHGWNAHDYNAPTLASFFDLVQKRDFPLSREEKELKQILLANGIIKESGGTVSAGEGAIISLSRESNEYLRALFMAHEGFHGIFFVDAEFRAFCESRWKNLDRTAKRILLSYFDFQQYDVKDEYLLTNEFMAHIMQQSPGAAAEYFGKTVAGRLDASDWRRAALPPKNPDTGYWGRLGEVFENEAYAFSQYARRRWNLDCGRVWRLKSGGTA